MIDSYQNIGAENFSAIHAGCNTGIDGGCSSDTCIIS